MNDYDKLYMHLLELGYQKENAQGLFEKIGHEAINLCQDESEIIEDYNLINIIIGNKKDEIDFKRVVLHVTSEQDLDKKLEKFETAKYKPIKVKKFTPFITTTAATINVVVFVLIRLNILKLTELAIIDSPNVTFFDNGYRLLTAAFTHEGVMHIFMNLLFIITVGRMIEQRIGHLKYFFLYFGAALFSSIIVVMLTINPAITFGASGVAYALVGYQAVLEYHYHRKFSSSTIYLVIFGIVISLFIPGISWQGHLGGLLFGIAYAYVLEVASRKPRQNK